MGTMAERKRIRRLELEKKKVKELKQILDAHKWPYSNSYNKREFISTIITMEFSQEMFNVIAGI